MKVRMLIGMLLLALLTAPAVGLGQAQGTDPSREAQPEGAADPAGSEWIVESAIPIQGRLTDATGNPVPNGDYLMTFRLYNAHEGGDLLCEYSHDAGVTDGLFNAFLGCAPDDINGQGLWLEVQVEGDEAMLPRRQIGPVPYALSLRPGAVISDTRTYAQLNGAVDYLLSRAGVIGKAVGAGSLGVFGSAEGGAGAGVYGQSASGNGYGGYFVNTVSGGVGVYASAGDGNTADIKLGSNSDSATGDNGRIQSTDYSSSDILLVSNDDTEFHLDENDNEDGAFRIYNGADNQILGAYETGLVRLNINAGPAQSITVGDRYRDNAIVAWAKLSGGNPGTIQARFGVSSVDHYNTGCYKIYLDIDAAESASLIPMAIAEIDSAPVGAGAIRIVSVNQVEPDVFNVYINDGNGNLVDNDFVFMVTAR